MIPHPELTPVCSVSSVDARSILLDQLQRVGRDRLNVCTTATVTTTDTEAGKEDENEKPRKKSIFATFASASTSAADKSEDSSYLAMPVLPDADPSVYWSEAQKEFPNMAMLARRYARFVMYCN